MAEVVNGLVKFQIGLMASSPTSAAVFVTVLDCLIVYAASLYLRRKAGHGEMTVVVIAITVVVLAVLEFMVGA